VSSMHERWGLADMALGIALGGVATARDWQRMLGWVERAEALGLHSVWLPEMHFAPNSTACPLQMLAGFAARTRKLRLATTSLLLPIHAPLRLAEEIAALQDLSEGRLILGLGRGFRAPLFQAYGIDASSKRDRFDEALALMRSAWSGRTTSTRGTCFDDDSEPDRPLELAPLSPEPPLAVAAFGKMGLGQAARHALPYLCSPLEPDSIVAENQAVHAAGLPEGFDRATLVVPLMRIVHVAADDTEKSRVLSAMETEARVGLGRAPRAIARAAAAPVSERAIVGTLGEVVDRVAAQRERLGTDLLITRPILGGATPAEGEASLERLATEVIPKLAG